MVSSACNAPQHTIDPAAQAGTGGMLKKVHTVAPLVHDTENGINGLRNAYSRKSSY